MIHIQGAGYLIEPFGQGVQLQRMLCQFMFHFYKTSLLIVRPAGQSVECIPRRSSLSSFMNTSHSRMPVAQYGN